MLLSDDVMVTEPLMILIRHIKKVDIAAIEIHTNFKLSSNAEENLPYCFLQCFASSICSCSHDIVLGFTYNLYVYPA